MLKVYQCYGGLWNWRQYVPSEHLLTYVRQNVDDGTHHSHHISHESRILRILWHLFSSILFPI
jgi:hypothetical protein